MPGPKLPTPTTKLITFTETSKKAKAWDIDSLEHDINIGLGENLPYQEGEV